VSTPEEPADVEALQHEVDSLRDRNRELEEAKEHESHGATGVLRSTGVVLLMVIATLCMVLAPVTIWGRNLVLNTDRYVSTLKPVASDPGVQAAIIAAVDRQFDQNVDVSSLVQQNLPPRASVLAGPIEAGVEGFINTVTTRFVESPAFVTLWEQMNRTAHAQLVYLLTGGHLPGNGGVNFDPSSGAVTLQLAPIITTVKAQLVASGLTVASNIPVVGATYEIVQLKGLAQARKYVRWLNTAAWVLPILALVLFAGAIALARRRRRALITASFCTIGAMLFIGLGLLIGRHFYLHEIPTDKIPRSTAGYLFDTLVRYLRDGIRTVAIIALVVAIGAWISGPGRHATSWRTWIVGHSKSGLDATLRSPVGHSMVKSPWPWRAGIGVLALIILVFFTGWSWTAFIVLVILAALLVAALEAMRRRVPTLESAAEHAAVGSPTTPS
jgi:uncharacterized membrane protein YgdD (TMEM256/DUF423 family)